MKTKLAISLSVVAATVWLTAGCGHKPAEHSAEQLPVATVRVQSAERKMRAATEDVVGTVRAKLRASIEAKVSGRIERMPVVQGQFVKAGDLLAQLDAREVQARLDQASAARDQANQDMKRFTELLRQNVATQSEFDAVQARYRIAQATVAEAETMLGYARVTAPFDGVVTRKYADVGDLASPGKPLLDMEDSTVLRLEADVPEALVEHVNLGDKLPVRISAIERQFEGVVSEIAPAADPNSRTSLVKLDLPATSGLRAGQFGRVAVPVGEAAAVRVPASAIVLRGQMEIVFVVADGHAQLRLVKTGKRVGDEVEVVSGLENGEKVVIAGGSELRDGQPVEAK